MSCTTSTSCIAVAVPGPPGSPATDGTNGTNGADAFGTILDDFLMPDEQDVTPSLLCDDSRAMVPGAPIYVQGAGVMIVVSKADTTHVVLQNPADVNTDAYQPPINSVGGTSLTAPIAWAPTGFQGPSGA